MVKKRSKALVLYSFYETPDSLESLEYFMNNGMHRRQDVFYCLIINGSHTLPPLQSKWDKVITRSNVGHDFGAWREGLLSFNLDDYDYYCCLNDTVRGPYAHYPDWLTPFTSLLSKDTLLSGLTINCCTFTPYTNRHGYTVVPHVQSMFWVTNKFGLNVIWSLLMSESPTDKDELIIQKELGMSMVILNRGYNISGILSRDQRDYRQKHKWKDYAKEDETSHNGDPWFEGGYYGKTLNPKETIFYKYSRLPLKYRLMR